VLRPVLPIPDAARRVAAVLLLAGAAAVDASTVQGRVELLLKSGDRPSRTARPQDAVVYFVPAVAKAGAPAVGSYSITTRNKDFEPRVLVIGAGSTVRFPNQDPILHNVFSVSGENRFDLGLYNRGPGKEVTFHHPGTVRVYCNVHRAMAAYVLVLGTQHWQRPGDDGSYRFDGLPTGEGVLHVWHERADPLEVKLSLDGRIVHRDLDLRITKPRLAAHLDKHGRRYEERGREYQ
jgi:plastocyanin